MHAPRIRRITQRTALSIAAVIIALAIGALVVQAATKGEAAKSRKKAKAFVVKGEIVTPLRPGSRSAVRVSVANNKYTAIWVTKLRMSISIDAAHAAAGCSVTRDFEIGQLSKQALPVKLKAARKVRRLRGKRRVQGLAWRGVSLKASNGLPTITMRNLTEVNQDACKGATLNLIFSGRATNKKPVKRSQRK